MTIALNNNFYVVERRFDYIEDNQAEQSAKIAEQSAKIDALTQVSVMLLSEVQGYKRQGKQSLQLPRCTCH